MDYLGIMNHVTNRIKYNKHNSHYIPFVTTEVRKPIRDPIPVFNACFTPIRETTSSAITAPKNGPTKIPATGMTNGPIRSPIVLPHMPALEPPNFLTPTRFDNVSAPNNKMTNRICILQNQHFIPSNVAINP